MYYVLALSLECQLPEDRSLVDGGIFSFCTVCAQLIFAAQNELIGLLRKIELSHSRMKRSNDEFSTVTPPQVPTLWEVGFMAPGKARGCLSALPVALS